MIHPLSESIIFPLWAFIAMQAEGKTTATVFDGPFRVHLMAIIPVTVPII
jgi:hypothetical protein